MQHFTVTNPLADVFHIQDAGQVCFTLLRGSRETLLWDTGMGFYNVAECIAPYVRGKLHVVLSHAHYDHACGQHYFEESFVHPVDLERCRKTVGHASRAAILHRMRVRGILEDNYNAENYVNGTPNSVKPLDAMAMDLGGLSVRFILAPGHTKGSIVAWIEEKKLLLTGDTWNPHTWLFFPESMPLAAYAHTVKEISALPAAFVLRPHDIAMVPMQKFRDYANGLHEDTFAKAEPCPIPPYMDIHTYCCYPEKDSKLVFNGDKRS
ncbi:MAG: MBL fold metallo-hydrolase [Firmicutes bacterium]|nr:MBL fold metallo-hydrolase [Bacillota bacterium]